MKKSGSDRPQMPALYNEARIYERPIPGAELSIDEILVKQIDHEEEEEELKSTFCDLVELNAIETNVKPEIADEDLIAFDGLFDLDDETESSRIDVAEVLENSAHGQVIDDNLNGTNVAIETQQCEERERQINENVRQVLLYGEKVVLDADVEYISMPGQKLEPIKDEPEYRVKCNDLLSGRKAFKQYVIYCVLYYSIFFMLSS